MTKYAVIIPFRDRGTDPRRTANLEVVMAWWWAHKVTPLIVDDGLTGDAPFNRHRAYNRAVSGNSDIDVFVFSEADMIIPMRQVTEAIWEANHAPGLVVPFTQYRYLSDETTNTVRNEFTTLDSAMLSSIMQDGYPFYVIPESTMDNGKSIGAVNVVSRETLSITGGFTEATHGNWYDDNIIEEGFAYMTNRRTRHIAGPAVHLYHLPGWQGDHLTDEDKAATARNKELLLTMRENIQRHNHAAVLNLLSYREDAR